MLYARQKARVDAKSSHQHSEKGRLYPRGRGPGSAGKPPWENSDGRTGNNEERCLLFQRVNDKLPVEKETCSLPSSMTPFPFHIHRNQDSCYPKQELFKRMGSRTVTRMPQGQLSLPRGPAGSTPASECSQHPPLSLLRSVKRVNPLTSTVFMNERKRASF